MNRSTPMSPVPPVLSAVSWREVVAWSAAAVGMVWLVAVGLLSLATGV